MEEPNTQNNKATKSQSLPNVTGSAQPPAQSSNAQTNNTSADESKLRDGITDILRTLVTETGIDTGLVRRLSKELLQTKNKVDALTEQNEVLRIQIIGSQPAQEKPNRDAPSGSPSDPNEEAAERNKKLTESIVLANLQLREEKLATEKQCQWYLDMNKRLEEENAQLRQENVQLTKEKENLKRDFNQLGLRYADACQSNHIFMDNLVRLGVLPPNGVASLEGRCKELEILLDRIKVIQDELTKAGHKQVFFNTMEEYTRSCSRSPYARQSLPSLNIVPVPTQNRGQFGLIQTPPAPVQPNAIGGGQTPQPISGPFAQAQPQGTVQGFRRNGTHLNQTGNMQQWVAGPSQAQFPSPNQQQSQLNGFNQFGDIPQGQQQRIPQASLFQVQVPQGPNSGQQRHYFHHYESQPPHPVQGVQVPPVRGVTTLQQVPPGTQPPSSQIPHGQGQPIRIAYVPQPGGTVQQQPHIQPTSPPNVPPNGDPQQRHDQPNKRFPTAWNPSQPLVSQMGHHWAFAGRPLGVDTNVTGPRNGQLGSQGKGSAPFSANGASTRSPISTNTPISNGSPVQGWDGPPSHIPLLYPNNSPVVGPSFKRAAPGASQLTADIIDLTLDDNEGPHLRPLKRRKTDSDIPQVVHANGSGGAVPNLPGQNSLDVSGGVPLPPTSGPPVRSPASGLLSTEEQSQPDTTARPSLTLEQTGMRVDENAMEQDKSIASQPPAVSAQEATEPPVPVQESAGPTPVILAQELNIPPPVQEPTGSPPVVSAQEANEHQVSERAQDNTVPEPEPEPEPTPTDWRENPDIIETLNSVFVMSEEDNSAKLCALCRLRHNQDPVEWPVENMAVFKNPTLDELGAHLQEVHTAPWEAIINPHNFSDMEDEGEVAEDVDPANE